jgi:hypothetical protein
MPLLHVPAGKRRRLSRRPGGTVAADEHHAVRGEAFEALDGLDAHDWEVVTEDAELDSDEPEEELVDSSLELLPSLDSELVSCAPELVSSLLEPEPVELVSSLLEPEPVELALAEILALARLAAAVRAGSWPEASWT